MKSCARPPVSWPTASIFCDWRSFSSLRAGRRAPALFAFPGQAVRFRGDERGHHLVGLAQAGRPGGREHRIAVIHAGEAAERHDRAADLPRQQERQGEAEREQDAARRERAGHGAQRRRGQLRQRQGDGDRPAELGRVTECRHDREPVTRNVLEYAFALRQQVSEKLGPGRLSDDRSGLGLRATLTPLRS